MPALDPFSSRFLTGKMSHQCRLIGATKFDDDEVKIKAFLIMALHTYCKLLLVIRNCVFVVYDDVRPLDNDAILECLPFKNWTFVI